MYDLFYKGDWKMGLLLLVASVIFSITVGAFWTLDQHEFLWLYLLVVAFGGVLGFVGVTKILAWSLDCDVDRHLTERLILKILGR